jgi:hypothetical protein
MTALRINPRALRVAAAKALAAGPLDRDFNAYDEDDQRAILAQAEVLIRAYEDARKADLDVRKGRAPAPAASSGALL